MPAIDVTELLSDPDFATTFTVSRNGVTVGSNGETIVSSVVNPGIQGVVQPATSADLQRLPDGEYQKGAIKIWTTFRLTTGGAGRTADVVQWNGGSYTIQSADDWSQYGAGFIQALGTLKDLNP